MAHRMTQLGCIALAASLCAQEPVGTSPLPSMLERHCAECHVGDEAEGSFDLRDAIEHAQREDDAAQQLRRAVARVRSRTMPPPDHDEQPTATDRSEIATELVARIPVDVTSRIATARRLSRVEWQNTVRDLCGVEVDATEWLPEDPRVRGFDNFGDGAGETPLMFEAHLDAAHRVADRMRGAKTPHELFDASAPFEPALARFVAAAFRREALASEVADRLGLYLTAISRGASESEARKAAVVSVLASPSFLLRVEVGEGEGAARLTLHELATRLSYAFAATSPDAALLADAKNGALRESSVVRAHARRLVAQTKGRALAERFFGQWLRFCDVLTANADFRRYPQIWKHSLRPAFFEEATLLCAEIAREDGSLLWLLDCDHTWANESLCEHYGLPPKKGSDFARVALKDRRRGGVLGMGAMLMVSSHTLRTSPVLRGKWILDLLLDVAPPPPPANVGSLPKDDEPVRGKSLRAQLEAHRGKRACASCHAQIDPLGFALENFDVLGRWREELHGAKVDARATLPDGAEVDGPIALKDALLARKDEFARAFVRRLLAYVVGRDAALADEHEIDRIANACAAGGFRFWALVDAVLESPLFTMRDPGGVK